MNKKVKKLNSDTCKAKRCITKLVKPASYLLKVLWAAGASMIATVASPPLPQY